jgi:putative ABC transport system substrate-binding protein
MIPGQTLAQQRRPAISYLSLSPQADLAYLPYLLDTLTRLGYRRGLEFDLEFLGCDDDPAKLGPAIDKLVSSSPDLIVAGLGTMTAQAAKSRTDSIPIVFCTAAHPVSSGLVATLRAPGANLTGVSAQLADAAIKRLELLQEVLPVLQRVAVVRNPLTSGVPALIPELVAAARELSLQIGDFPAASAKDYDAPFAAAARWGAEAIVLLEDPVALALRSAITQFERLAGRPVIYGDRSFVEAGGLISFGADRRESFRRAAFLVHRILKGAHPSALPVEQPKTFELALNMRAASSLGLTIPIALAARADLVVE